jgi:hypothetical protein
MSIRYVSLLFLTSILFSCSKQETPERFLLYVVGNLQGTHVSIWLDNQPLAGGFLSSEDALGLAFQMRVDAVPGSSIELRINEDEGDTIRASFTVPHTFERHILAAIQRDKVIFLSQENAPTFQ